MNHLIGPLLEHIVVQDVLAGRDPHPQDLAVAAEWNYRLWRASGRASEIAMPGEAVIPTHFQRKPMLSRVFDWFNS